MKNTNDTGFVSAVTTKETIEAEFKNGKEVNSKEYCSLCKKYMKPMKYDGTVRGGVECNGIFASCGEIPCKHFEPDSYTDTHNRWPALTNAFNKALEYDWTFHATNENDFVITVLDPDGWEPIVAKTDKFLAEHICKIHNDWRNFKMKNGKKKVKKGNLRRLKNLAWRMKTFREAFKAIEKNKYLGFDSIRIWIEQNEDDVNQWIFTKWLKNSSNYEDWMWFFNNQGDFVHNIAPNEYSEISYNCLFTGYFVFGKSRSINGVPDGKWDPYTLHDEYEGKLFPGGEDWATALVLEKMFDFAEDYVKHNGWITAEMADKYHIDLYPARINSDSDVLLDKMDPDTANCVRKIVEESDDKLFEKNPELKGEDVNFKKPLEQRVDNLEKMVKDIWTNVCADKRQA